MCSLSLVLFFSSWHGPKKQPLPQPDELQEPPLPPDQPFNQHFFPIDQQYMPLDDPQEPFFQPNPFPTPAFTNSMRATPPPDNYLYDKCKSPLIVMSSKTSSYTLSSPLGIETQASYKMLLLYLYYLIFRSFFIEDGFLSIALYSSGIEILYIIEPLFMSLFDNQPFLSFLCVIDTFFPLHTCHCHLSMLSQP
jgi:hypothetical protein